MSIGQTSPDDLRALLAKAREAQAETEALIKQPLSRDREHPEARRRTEGRALSMPRRELSDRTLRVIDKMFPPEQHAQVRELLREVSDLGIDRVRLAVLSTSGGAIDALLGAIEQARLDWRDPLVAAGFTRDISEHKRWAEEYLAGS